MIIPIVKQYIKLSRNTCMHKKLIIPIMYIYLFIYLHETFNKIYLCTANFKT